MRGLTGRSTGGATAGCLARAAPFVYPAPRGQGNLPRPPDYLYVRPRRRQCPDSRSLQLASVALVNRGWPRAAPPALVVAQHSVRFSRFAPGKAIVLRGGVQGSVVVGASRQRAAPRTQFCGRAARGRPGLLCRRRARGARGRQRFGCQRRWERWCMRGLTGRSTGGAAAGRLVRAAPFVYPAPRGQGGLPRHPGYLYVRPRKRQCPGSRSLQLVSVALANRGRPRAAPLSLVVAQHSARFSRFAPGKASALRRCAE